MLPRPPPWGSSGASHTAPSHRSLRRIHVNGLHEPARLVGADGQKRQGNRTEPQPNIVEQARIGGVAGRDAVLGGLFIANPASAGGMNLLHSRTMQTSPDTE